MMLTARDALAKVLAQHEPWGGGQFCHCLPTDGDGRSEPLPGSWEQHLADALLASDFWAKLAEDDALVERLATASGIMSGSRDADPDDVANILTAFAAELMPGGDHGAR